MSGGDGVGNGLNDWLSQVKGRLERCKSDLVLGNSKTRTDLALAVEVIEIMRLELENIKAGENRTGQAKHWAAFALAKIDALLKGSGET